MKQITKPRKIFKISSSRFKQAKWDLSLDFNTGEKLEEVVSLADGQHFRIIEDILGKKENVKNRFFHKYIFALIVENKVDYNRATGKKGIRLNGKVFRRFLGTTGGLKKNTVLFVNEDIYEEFTKRIECGRNKKIKLLPAKLEAYKALSCSSSIPIPNPIGVLVVRDCITKFKSDVINIDDSDESKEPIVEFRVNEDLENNVSDGFNLVTPEYMKRISKHLDLDYLPSGGCIRNAYCKGMANVFDFIEFDNRYGNGTHEVTDVWGNTHDIRNIEMILTESSLKLWNCYDSIEDYLYKCEENGFTFAFTKVTPKDLEDERALNYQYLQSYEMSDDDIMELISPTIEWLKCSMGGDYESALRFLGVDDKTQENDYTKALYLDKRMLEDPYVIDKIKRLIKKKVDQAKIGKLNVHGNYQLASGDPFALMQSIMGLEVTGLLKANQCYSKYWVDDGENEILVFRSPMTSHHNIRKLEVVDNEEIRFWYQYQTTIIIINSWDTFCMAENGEDWDGDSNFTTNNHILKKNFRDLPAIQCVQRGASKIIVTEKDLIESNLNGMGNKVGSITNRVTSFEEVKSRFDKDSEEYKILSYRTLCGQLYQQNELDKIKGIVATEMPKSWYTLKQAKENGVENIVADKKPYFMIYIYPHLMKEYKKYVTNANIDCLTFFGIDIDKLELLEQKSNEQEDFLMWYYKKYPVGRGMCTMNRICYMVEKEMSGYTSQLKSNSNFDYSFLKPKRRCTEEHRKGLKGLYEEYRGRVIDFNKDVLTKKLNKDDSKLEREQMIEDFKQLSIDICPNDEERLAIILDICYTNSNSKQFCWDTVGELIIKHLEVKNGIDNQ